MGKSGWFPDPAAWWPLKGPADWSGWNALDSNGVPFGDKADCPEFILINNSERALIIIHGYSWSFMVIHVNHRYLWSSIDTHGNHRYLP